MPPPAPAVAPAAERVTLTANTYFDFDKTALKPEARATLSALAEKIRDIRLEVVIAVGHADWTGTDAYNLRLSRARAEAVKRFLVGQGIEANRIFTEGKGERSPIADNRTREGRAKNRRVEVEAIGTKLPR